MVAQDPRDLTWDRWCAKMADQYAAQQLGTVPEEQWRDWGAAFAGLGRFTKSSVPDPRGFATWQAWAEILPGIVA